MKPREAIDKLEGWWSNAPEWQRRSVIGGVAALAGFVFGFAVVS